MIRKDRLPRVWGDDWQCEEAEVQLNVARSDRPTRIVLCDTEADWPLFHIDSSQGYATQVAQSSSANRLRLHIEEGASVELYRLQGVQSGQPHFSQWDILMEAGARLTLGTFTFGGEHNRNNVAIRMQGEGGEVDAFGLYLLDREQQCDNYIFIEHQAPHCTSHSLYKGILDDAAHARFNGHVLVQDGAIKTEAHQTNRNILLTDKAHVDTRPFLEIYNDDVKCSHGSTIGQLDEQALFYLRTRGISQRTAITMLSYAFCDEVIARIGIPELREAVADVVKKRLHGELSPLCDDCSIRCSSPCNGEEAHFAIDPSKL